jgi:hypothetical protein
MERTDDREAKMQEGTWRRNDEKAGARDVFCGKKEGRRGDIEERRGESQSRERSTEYRQQNRGAGGTEQAKGDRRLGDRRHLN